MVKPARSLVLLAFTLGCQGDPDSGRPPDTTPPSDEVPVLSGWPDPEDQSEPTLPWSIEAQADVAAVGVVGEPLERDGRQLLALRLEQILYGDAALGEVFPEDDAPFFGCLPPPSIPKPSETFAPGTELVIYLTRSEGRLAILHLSTRLDRVEPLRRFYALKRAMLSAEPDWDAVFELGPAGREQQLAALCSECWETPAIGKALAANFHHLLERLRAEDPAQRPDLELLLQRAHILRDQVEPACLDALGTLVDWLLEQGELARIRDVLPYQRGLLTVTDPQRQAWLERVDRLAQHESLQRAAEQLRKLLTR